MNPPVTLPAARPTPSIQLVPAKTGLTLIWPDGLQSFYHYAWLRDCCDCDLCGNSYSSKRYLQPADVPLDSLPETACFDSEGYLQIAWKEEDHVSRFDSDWLRRYSYHDGIREQRFHRPVTWDAQIVENLPSVEYRYASTSDQGRLELYRKLRDFGFVVVTSGPPRDNGYQRVAQLVGTIAESAYGQVFDLTPQSKITTLGNTMLPVPPHTDEAYRHNPPGINILHCVRPAETAGESVLVDGFRLGEQLRRDQPEVFELLCRQPQPFHRIDPENHLHQQTRAPVFVLDELSEIVGFRFHTRSAAPLDVPSDRFLKIYSGNRALSQMMLSPEYQARFRLEAGDAVLFDNHRVMHARLGFHDRKRKLRICNVSREQFHENLRLTANKLGYPDEARQILAAGVCG